MVSPDKQAAFRRGAWRRPTECGKCQKHVTAAMEGKARMILIREGRSAARAFFDEELEPFHSGH